MASSELYQFICLLMGGINFYLWIFNARHGIGDQDFTVLLSVQNCNLQQKFSTARQCSPPCCLLKNSKERFHLFALHRVKFLDWPDQAAFFFWQQWECHINHKVLSERRCIIIMPCHSFPALICFHSKQNNNNHKHVPYMFLPFIAIN